MKKLLLFCLLALTTISYSQKLLDTVDYNDFKAYNIRYSALNFIGSVKRLQSLDNRDQKRSDFGLVLNYSSFKNLEKSQTNFQSHGSYSNGTTSGIYVSPSIDYRKYFRKKQFFETNTDFYFYNQFLKNSIDNNQMEIQFEARYGIGRIDPIDAVFLGRFIIEDLEKEGIDIKNIDQKKLFEMSDIIATSRNRRVLDRRRQLLYQFDEVSNYFLRDSSYTKEEVRKISGVIFDNLIFAFNNRRNSGARISIGNSVRKNFQSNKFNPKFSSFGHSNFMTLKADYSKALNKNFQIDGTLFIGTSFENYNVTFNNIYEIYTICGIGYYPNSRTFFNISSVYIPNNFEKDFGVQLEVNYFLTYFTNITLSVGNSKYLNQNLYNPRVDNSIELDFRINHSIF